MKFTQVNKNAGDVVNNGLPQPQTKGRAILPISAELLLEVIPLPKTVTIIDARFNCFQNRLELVIEDETLPDQYKKERGEMEEPLTVDACFKATEETRKVARFVDWR